MYGLEEMGRSVFLRGRRGGLMWEGKEVERGGGGFGACAGWGFICVCDTPYS